MMSESMNIGQYDYQIGKLNALDQLHVSRRIAPIIPTVAPLLVKFMESGLGDELKQEAVNMDLLKELAPSFTPFAEALAEMSDEHANYVIGKCLSVVRRKTDSGFASVWRGQTLAFDDLEMSEILPLVIAVLRTSLGNFIAGLRTSQTEVSLG